MDVRLVFMCCVDSGLCDELITRSEESSYLSMRVRACMLDCV